MGDRTTWCIFGTYFKSRALKTREKYLCLLQIPFSENACSTVANQSSTFEPQKDGRNVRRMTLKAGIIRK